MIAGLRRRPQFVDILNELATKPLSLTLPDRSAKQMVGSFVYGQYDEENQRLMEQQQMNAVVNRSRSAMITQLAVESGIPAEILRNELRQSGFTKELFDEAVAPQEQVNADISRLKQIIKNEQSHREAEQRRVETSGVIGGEAVGADEPVTPIGEGGASSSGQQEAFEFRTVDALPGGINRGTKEAYDYFKSSIIVTKRPIEEYTLPTLVNVIKKYNDQVPRENRIEIQSLRGLSESDRETLRQEYLVEILDRVSDSETDPSLKREGFRFKIPKFVERARPQRTAGGASGSSVLGALAEFVLGSPTR